MKGNKIDNRVFIPEPIFLNLSIPICTYLITLSKLVTNKPKPTTIKPIPVDANAKRKAFIAPVEAPTTKE